MSKIVKYSIRKGSTQHFNGVSVTDQAKLIKQSFNYIAEVCDIIFIKVEDEKKANVRISFWNSRDMIKIGNVGIEYRALTDPSTPKRWMALNNQTPINWTQSAVFMVMHEMGHVLLGNGHTQEKTMMHPWGSYYIGPKEAITLQRRYGKPRKIFYPWDKAEVGKKNRALKAKYDILMEERMRLLALRDGSTDKVFRTATQVKVLANLDKIRENMAKRKLGNKEWWRLKRLWNTVPFAG